MGLCLPKSPTKSRKNSISGSFTSLYYIYYSILHLQMERQIILQNEMRQRGMATQLAFSREMFTWLASFYVIATTGCIVG